MRCPACANDNPDEFVFCIECGAHLVDLPVGQPGGEPWGQQGRHDAEPHGSQPRPDVPYAEGGDRRSPQLGDWDRQGSPRNDGPHQAGYGDGASLGGQGGYGEQGGYGGRGDSGGQAVEPRSWIVVERAGRSTEYPLDTPVLTIGRSRSNDISLDDNRVSRQHARIFRDGATFFVEDLNSRNGTRVDDRAVHGPQPLHDGAVIAIGDTVVRFRTEGAAALGPSTDRDQQAARSAASEPFAVQSGARPPTSAHGDEGGVPVIFHAPWEPVVCPRCQAIKTMRPIVYGEAARTPAAAEAARRGDVVLGGVAPGPGLANAQCQACGVRARIIPTSP